MPGTIGIVINLLHPSKGHPIQQWQLDQWQLGDDKVIRIGRAVENDITIADPQVSRVHAELRFQDGAWELRNLGRNGTICEGKNVEKVRLATAVTFQLGVGGPVLEFLDSSLPINEVGTTTIINATNLANSLVVDEKHRDRELEQIVDTPFFQHLQQSASELRRKRTPSGQDDG